MIFIIRVKFSGTKFTLFRVGNALGTAGDLWSSLLDLISIVDESLLPLPIFDFELGLWPGLAGFLKSFDVFETLGLITGFDPAGPKV